MFTLDLGQTSFFSAKLEEWFAALEIGSLSALDRSRVKMYLGYFSHAAVQNLLNL